MALDQRRGEILMGADEFDPIALEQRGVGAVRAQGLALEDDLGNPVNQILDGGRDV